VYLALSQAAWLGGMVGGTGIEERSSQREGEIGGRDEKKEDR
jgi:hypothetical protein